ncbi:hypothetical protein GYMLUDRAFT_936628, partial [Collybiopsis luxurians FD-317 M1]
WVVFTQDRHHATTSIDSLLSLNHSRTFFLLSITGFKARIPSKQSILFTTDDDRMALDLLFAGKAGTKPISELQNILKSLGSYLTPFDIVWLADGTIPPHHPPHHPPQIRPLILGRS